ncbi:MAG: hypothetical protein LBB89_12845 [Treponema sp.]|jgi:hypothetical protein|nr:hypothetical protein [Treponema sp.]
MVLFIAIIIGIQPVFAQSGTDASVKPAATEKTDQEGETVININLASDDEFAHALETAADIELVNEETENSDKNPSQGNSK